MSMNHAFFFSVQSLPRELHEKMLGKVELLADHSTPEFSGGHPTRNATVQQCMTSHWFLMYLVKPFEQQAYEIMKLCTRPSLPDAEINYSRL
jgi:hypothetical protein